MMILDGTVCLAGSVIVTESLCFLGHQGHQYNIVTLNKPVPEVSFGSVNL